MELIQDKQKKSFEVLKGDFGWTNRMQAPQIKKVVVSVGVGRMTKDKGKVELVADRLAKITGQKPATRGAKKAISTYKTRIGDLVGYQITLRGARMQSFFDKLVNVVFPRVKDFRGIKKTAIDEMGNISIGFKEHTVFPETSDEDAKDVFGLAVTIVTTAKTTKEAEAFLRFKGVPLQA